MKPQSRQVRSHMAGTLSIGRLARRWNISGKEVRRLLRDRRLQFEEITGHIRIPLGEVERYEASLELKSATDEHR